MTVATSSFLDHLQMATRRSDEAETALREEMVTRLRKIEEERKFAYRRFNFMRSVVEGMQSADSEEIAVACALGVLRTKLGWSNDSEARQAICERFASVAQAIFACRDRTREPEADVIATLARFETWYHEKHGSAFWILFEHYIPETPVVDF
ncbi:MULTISPECIES: hypothetical protein [unclassified Beijerinckia]|uniref:hypothetical protein n=1 Tax=unclassified Beijerinckia TaxID=2638183 RepID=UPI0008944925|nr:MULTISPECIES: hypothetical protein [unclassified Beijerinckia]MDH7795837.1 hypothetical protein [Beijerinckia sp. GAS462]SEC18510.1 hypothetical protein SAMN05443249_2115 [Beijerinckia sp. 28-YEA-48]